LQKLLFVAMLKRRSDFSRIRAISHRPGKDDFDTPEVFSLIGMLDTPQRYPRTGSQSYPSPAAEAGADGSTTIYFGPKQPDGVKRGNWIQTDPKKGWFVILRRYSPLQPFFDKSWRPSEIELVP
jgi:hypothetical protein